MAVIALALTLVGPRIGAGIGRLELEQAAQNIRTFIKAGRSQAQRKDQEHYIVIDKKKNSMTLLDREMHQIRHEELPSAIQVVSQQGSETTNIFIAPSGILRGEPIRIRGRSGEAEVVLE